MAEPNAPAAALPRVATWQLFAICVLVWSTTWHVITYQLTAAPELGVTWRFALAGALVLAVRAAVGERLRFGWRAHLRFAAQGAALYGVSYICVYHAERHLPSGLVAVGYSASPLVSGIAAHWLWKAPLTPRFLIGGVLGMAGVALIFAPEFHVAATGRHTGIGVLFTTAAVLIAAAGSLVASRNVNAGLPMWPSLGFGMLYAAAVCAVVVVASGQTPLPPPALSWWVSLLYLALAGSVLTFACFLTLQQRIGVGRAGTIGVMTPMLALVVSAVFEGYHPTAVALTGLCIAALGNVLMLRRA